MFIKRSFLLLTILFSQHSLAATVQDGYDALERGDVEQGIEIWRDLAEQGDTTAQLNMGQLYRLGNGVTASDEEAVRWYIKAAKGGSSIAKYNLVMMHEDGRAGEDDLEAIFGPAPDDPAPDAGMEQPEALEDNKWIRGVAPDTSLLQLLGSSNAQALEDYSSENLSDAYPPTQVIATRMKGRDWYLLVMGPFDTRDRAISVRESLPIKVKSQGVWIRTAESIQAIASADQAANK